MVFLWTVTIVSPISTSLVKVRLHYSRCVDGCILLSLCIFAPSQVGGQESGYFITRPFKAWTKMSQKATAYAKCDYHSISITNVSEFLTGYENYGKQSSCSRVITKRIILLCGKQGFALCGHRDDQGLLSTDMQGQCYDATCLVQDPVVFSMRPHYFHCVAHWLNLAVVSVCMGNSGI